MKTKMLAILGLGALLLLPVACLNYGLGLGEEDPIDEKNQSQEEDEGRNEQELSCLDRSLDDCEATGCQVLEAYAWDVESGCRGEELQPAFCKPNPDILCDWEGDPVIMTEPDGTSWYMDWSCFTTPEDWELEYRSEMQPACGEEDLACIDRPVEDCEAHGCRVFDAYPYDADSGCHEEEPLPAFCHADPGSLGDWQKNPDIHDWQGDPVIMTEPDGTSWYMDWCCFSTPSDWDIEYVSDGTPACQ